MAWSKITVFDFCAVFGGITQHKMWDELGVPARHVHMINPCFVLGSQLWEVVSKERTHIQHIRTMDLTDKSMRTLESKPSMITGKCWQVGLLEG